MIMMTRAFLPVGQGAFYMETFAFDSGKATIIYDCGSSTDVHIVEQMIQNLFKPGEDIAGVFISHFDADHTNGLPFLLKHCHVKNLFFPLITKESQEFILLGDLTAPLHASAFFSSFVRNPYGAFQSLNLDYTPALYHILENGEDSESETQYSNLDARYILSGSDVSDILFDAQQCKEVDWRYIPFNFRETTRIAAFKKAMLKHFGQVCSRRDLQNLLNTGKISIDDIKQAYKDVPGSFNTNSMTVLSMSPNDCTVQSLSKFPLPKGHCPHPPHCSQSCVPRVLCKWIFANGCLYTGDYDAKGPQKWKELHNAYDKYDRYIGCVQIPHHGSTHNYNHQLLNIGHCLFYVISAGSNNKYWHPHFSVMKDILVSRRYPLIVTENSGTVSFDIFTMK